MKMEDGYFSLAIVLKTTTHFMNHVQSDNYSYDNLQSCAFCLYLIYYLHNDKVDYDDETEEEKELIELYGGWSKRFLDKIYEAQETEPDSAERQNALYGATMFLDHFHRNSMKLEHIRQRFAILEDCSQEDFSKHRRPGWM